MAERYIERLAVQFGLSEEEAARLNVLAKIPKNEDETHFQIFFALNC